MSLVTWMHFIIDVINIIFEEDLKVICYSQGEEMNDEGKEKSCQNKEYLQVKFGIQSTCYACNEMSWKEVINTVHFVSFFFLLNFKFKIFEGQK